MPRGGETGGGIFVHSGELNIYNSTLRNNRAGNGGDGGNLAGDPWYYGESNVGGNGGGGGWGGAISSPNSNTIIKFNVLAVDGAVGQLALYDIVFEAVSTAVAGSVSTLTLSAETMVDANTLPLRWRAEMGSLTVGVAPSNGAQLRVGDAQSSGQYTLEHGATLTVPVWAIDVANLGAATVELGFDPALLDPLGCTVSNPAPGIDGGQCVIEQNRVRAQFVAGQGFSGSTSLFEVLFTPRSGAPAGANASLLLVSSNFVDVNAAPLAWQARHGEIHLLPGASSNAPLFGLDISGTAPSQLALDGELTVTLGISGAVNVGAASVVVYFGSCPGASCLVHADHTV